MWLVAGGTLINLGRRVIECVCTYVQCSPRVLHPPDTFAPRPARRVRRYLNIAALMFGFGVWVGFSATIEKKTHPRNAEMCARVRPPSRSVPACEYKIYLARRNSERTLLEATFAITSSGRARDPRPARRISASSPPAAAAVHAAASTGTFAPWVAVARRRAFGHGAERG